jgi:hypothetical protein
MSSFFDPFFQEKRIKKGRKKDKKGPKEITFSKSNINKIKKIFLEKKYYILIYNVFL